MTLAAYLFRVFINEYCSTLDRKCVAAEDPSLVDSCHMKKMGEEYPELLKTCNTCRYGPLDKQLYPCLGCYRTAHERVKLRDNWIQIKESIF